MKPKLRLSFLTTIAVGALAGSSTAELIHHWDFQEGEGLVAGDIAGNNPGAITGALWGSDEIRDSYLIFNGSTDVVNPSLTLPPMNLENDFTWACWVNSQAPLNGGQRNAIVLGNRRDGSGADFTPREFLKLTPRLLEWRPMDQSEDADYTDLPLDSWNHVAVVKDGNTLTTFFNGTQNTVTVLNNPFVNLLPFFIGGEPLNPAGEFFTGFIDDVMLYDSALTTEEVVALLGDSERPPFWPSDPVIFGVTASETEIEGTLAIFASNPLDDELVYERVSGPEWLTVAADGTLGGSPLPADVGENRFVVSATNADGTTPTTLEIDVFDSNAVIPNDQLYGWWPLNDGSGSVGIDISGNGRDASIINVDTGGLDGGNVWVEDPECGPVLSFSGVTGEGAVATVDGFLPTITFDQDNAFTWSYWALGTDVVNGNGIIIGNRRNSEGQDFQPRQFLRFTGTGINYDTNNVQTLGYPPINTALGWAHHAVVRAGNTFTYYRNGVETGRRTVDTPLVGDVPIHFGGQANQLNERWNGSLFDVRLFEAELDFSQVVAVMNSKGEFPAFVPSVPETLELAIESAGDNLTLSWESQAGFVYNLRSNLTLETTPLEWDIFENNLEVVATPPMNTLTVARPTDARRFFVVEEILPAPTLAFSADFEDGIGNWEVTSNGAGTEWELGTATAILPSGAELGANSGVNAFGTNIAGDYTLDSSTTLRSEIIDLSAATEATLNLAYYIDADPATTPGNPAFDTAIISILSGEDDSVLETLADLGNESTNDWTDISFPIPAAALGSSIRLNFTFTSDGVEVGPGWYLDDITISVP